METCLRFDSEGALRLESGAAEDAHEAGCAACQAARSTHLHIAGAFRQLPPIALPEGWAEGVRARIGPAEVVAPTWWRWAGVAGGLAAAAVVLLLARCGSGGAGDARTAASMLPSVDHEVRSTAPERRAGSAVIGDTLVVRASAVAQLGDGTPAATRELRVYAGSWGNGARMVARCPGGDGCTVEGDRLELTTRLAAPGVYRTLLFVGAAPVPVTDSLDGDARAAEAAGVTVEVSGMTEVD